MSTHPISEANLSNNEIQQIQKQAEWINSFSDSIKEIPKNKGSYVDLSKVTFKTNSDYIDYFMNLKKSVNDILYICIDLYTLGTDIRSINNTNIASPVNAIYQSIRRNPSKFKNDMAGIIFIFYVANGYFSLSANNVSDGYHNKFNKTLADALATIQPVKYGLTGKPDVNKKELVDPIKPVENKDKVEAEDADKQILAKAVTKAAKTSKTEDDAIDKLSAEQQNADIMAKLAYIEDNKRGAVISKARRERMNTLNERLYNSEFKGKSVKELLKEEDTIEELPSTDIKIDSINDEWKDLKFMNFQEVYDIDSDIIKILHSFSDKSYPVSIVSIKVSDTSTKMDFINTYEVKCEDSNGKKFTWTIDVPQLVNNRFMMLRGNEKVISGQLTLLPCTKTSPDTVQLVSNYKKVFVRTHGAKGKTTSCSDRIVKTLNRFADGSVKGIKYAKGDFNTICAKYDNLPVDYIDLAGLYSYIEVKHGDRTITIMFDQDKLRAKYPANADRIPIGFYSDGIPIYYSLTDMDREVTTCSMTIANILSMNKDFYDVYHNIKPADRIVCSMASILNAQIPVIVILGYLNGITNTLNMANIKYNIHSSKADIEYGYDFIKIGNEYLSFQHTYGNSMLLYGLNKVADITQYNLADLDNKSTWINILGDIRDRLLSDGLENFDDLFVDPITKEICLESGDSTTFSGLLLEANTLLATNSFTKHTKITVNRYRSNEIIAGYLYNVMSTAYASYANGLRKGRKDPMSFKRTALIDALMQDATQTDLSTLSAVMEIEAANATSFKGLSGLNAERAYSLDKRTYDDSMINKVALSTGFASNVGITRQSTIDMNIKGKRGYIKPDTTDDMSVTKTFSITEAITPFGVTRDDPFRSAMTFIQTSKHNMRTNASAPLLITNGADEAIPHMTSDKFAFKAKDKGKVVELVEDKYMVITYNNGESEFINLAEQIYKNSDGGMYILLHLVPNFKLGKTFKKSDIIAHDKLSFSKRVGGNDNLAYNVGALVKIAIPNSDTGFEDSTACSQWMSEALASEIVLRKEITLSPNTNVYELVTPGQEIQEGDPLILFQNSFEEKDANLLLKAITDDELVSDLGRIRLKSNYTGWIQDVEIFRTKPIDTYSESIQKLIKLYDKKTKYKKDIYSKYSIKGKNKLEPDHPLPATGELKNVGDGIKINIYIKYLDKFAVGDKNVAQSAAKGVIKEIYPAGQEPRSSYRPEEIIHGVYSVGSFNARMITSVINSGNINKGLIELDRQVKEIMGIPWKYLEDIQMDPNSNYDLSK